MHHLVPVVAVFAIVGCSDSAPAPDASTPDAPPAMHAIVAKIALSPDADGQHVSFRTQNGSTVSLLSSDIAGKTVYWAITKGGDPAANAPLLDMGIGVIGADLTLTFKTPAHYARGPWEVSSVISVSGSPQIPAAGDLAAFDNTPPPAGEPPVTGVSVRVRVSDGDANVTLTNKYFIRFGAP